MSEKIDKKVKDSLEILKFELLKNGIVLEEEHDLRDALEKYITERIKLKNHDVFCWIRRQYKEEIDTRTLYEMEHISSLLPNKYDVKLNK